MARQNEGPWYRASKDGWYLTVNGKAVSLKVKGQKNKREAVEAWHRLMASPEASKTPQRAKEAPPKAKAEAKVKDVIDAFLSDAEGRVQPNTLATYRDILTPISEGMGHLGADGVTKAKVYAIVNRPNWGQARRHGALGVISMAWRQAEANGMIGTNPLKGLKRPPMPSRGREAVVSADDHDKLMKAVSPFFRPLLSLLRESGARPSELARLTAHDVDFGAGVAILTAHKTAQKTGKPRLIILTPKAVDILKAQAEAHPDGILFRTRSGKPWKKSRIVEAMTTAGDRAGVKAIAYGYRHAFATDALANGVPDATVAALLGHTGTAQLHKHYSHLTSRIQVLRDAANKVR